MAGLSQPKVCYSQPALSICDMVMLLAVTFPGALILLDHGWPIADCTSEAMLAVLGKESRSLVVRL